MGYHERLIELRKKNNYTQEELAGIIGVSRQAISKWESGMANPDIEKLIKLSELYGCSIDYIVGNDNKIDENRTNDELNKNIDEANNSENNNDNIDKRKKKINIIIGCLSAAVIISIIVNMFAVSTASNAVKEKKKIEDELEVYSAAAVADVTPVSDVIIYPNKKGLEKEMGFSVGEFTHFDCGDIKYETYAGVVAILQEEAVLDNWMRVTFYKTRESYDIINRYLIKARSYVYNNENVSKNLNEEINGVDVLIRGGDKKKEDDYVMSASWTANGFNYVVYAEKYVHMDELKQLVVDVMESEEYKAGK